MTQPIQYRLAALPLILLCAGASKSQTTVGYDRLLNAAKEPQNWLTYGGDYSSHHFSSLTQITPANVKNLSLAWVYQAAITGSWETAPLVIDGIMYLTQRLNDIVALDATTGRVFWIYHYENAKTITACCGSNNRGLAILGDTLFMGTLDGHLVAVDSKSGKMLWNTAIADSKSGYSIAVAPLALKDRVVIGVAGGEYGIRGFLAAYDARTGKEVWRFYTIPGPGEPDHETWEDCKPGTGYCDPDAWKHGGGSVWVTGSFDTELNLTYWGIGNVGPDYNADQRPGTNLYTDSVVALDADSGKLRWHYQFTPHDRYDYDSVEVPVLADIVWQGSPLKAMLWANRNGNFYVLDRTTGKFLLGKPFSRVNWMSGFDENGTPIQTVQPPGMPTYPAVQGATNWYSPSWSARTHLLYISAWDEQGALFESIPAEYKEGLSFSGGNNAPFVPRPDASGKAIPGAPPVPGLRRGPINTWTDAAGHGVVLAIDPLTGTAKWKYRMTDVTDTGIVATASDLLFTGGREGYLQALDARTGALLWKRNLGAQMTNNPITYSVNGRQYVAAAAGLGLFVFALPE
jgi:alcohol dehydrogenase (cytochrome c)